jgi:hypothetical protein
VPVLMPLQSMSTTQSAAVGGVSASSLTAQAARLFEHNGRP